MKTYFTFTKKGVFTFFALLVCVGFICCETAAVSNSSLNAKTNADRLIFVKNLGCTVLNSEPIAKSINIPEVFYSVYNNYNTIQQSAGYDLSQYKGCEAMLYTYSINAPNKYTGDCVVNLIVYKDKIIGGDISSAALGGFMLPLKKQRE